MAWVTMKAAEVKYVLELSKREAEALTELLLVVDNLQGEGEILDGVYAALCEAGCESMDTHCLVQDSLVIVSREDAE
jgi:hypothetical protein